MGTIVELTQSLLEAASLAPSTREFLEAAAGTLRQWAGSDFVSIEVLDEEKALIGSSAGPTSSQNPSSLASPSESTPPEPCASLAVSGPRGITGSIRLLGGDRASQDNIAEQLEVPGAIICEVVGRLEAEREAQASGDTETAINLLSRVAVAEITLEDSLREALQVILAIPWLHASLGGAIFLKEDHFCDFSMKAQVGLDESIRSTCSRLELETCLRGRTAQDGRPLFVDEGTAPTGTACQSTPHSHCCVPIASPHELLGVLSLHIEPGHLRRRSDEWSLMSIADSLSGIIVRKKTEEVLRDTLVDLRRRNTEISALLGCARSVLEHKDFRKAASAIVQECRAIVGGSAGYFARTQSDGTVEEAFFVDPHGAPRDLKAPAPLVGLPRDVWSTGQGGISKKTTSADAREPAIGELLGVESSLCVPLVLDSTVVGLLGIVNKAGGFCENDLRVATGFAEIAAVALRNSETSRLLEQSEELYRTLVEAITDAVDVKDADLRYAIVNSEQLRRLGRSQEEVVGKTLEEIVGEARASKYSAEDRQVLATGETLESESAFPDSRLPLICLNTKVPLRDKSGNVIGVVTVSRDVTERKRTHDQLLRAQRLETAGRIAGQVAHDFNNLLAPLALYPDLIKLSLSEDHPATRHLNAMLEIVQQMAQINANLLAMGRRGRMELQPVDLNSLLRHSLTQIVEVPSALRTEVELEPALWTVQGSSSQLLRVISNLIANAREAMQDCGILTLRTENAAIDGIKGQYGSIPAGEYVLLTVADTGCGIPAEHRDRIFDAFFTTKDSARRGGSGLGLSIVLSVISDHGGHVDLESEPGKGTGFFVYLPASRTRRVEAGKKAVAQGSEKVLVVDDEAPQREAVTQLLARLGYDARAVSSGEEAVEFVKMHSVDLIVLDIFMPGGMNGVDTLREIKKVRPGQKAVIISGYVDAEVARKARSLGIANYVHKPVTLDKLARTIREALDGVGELDAPQE